MEAKTATGKADTRTLFKITKEITGKFRSSSAPIMDLNWTPLAKSEDQKVGKSPWTVVDRVEPDNSAVFLEDEDTFPISMEPLWQREIERSCNQKTKEQQSRRRG